MVTFKGRVPAAPALKPCDLNGDRRQDVMPVTSDAGQISSYGALKNGSGTIPFGSAPNGIRMLPVFKDAVQYIACTDPKAWFYPPIFDSLLSFAKGQDVALLAPDGTLHNPITISGFVVGLKGADRGPVTDDVGRVLAQAIAVKSDGRHHQILVKDLVWRIGNERVNPNWVVAPPQKIALTPSEQMLVALFEDVKLKAVLPASPRERLQMIDSEIEHWAAAQKDHVRAEALTAEPLRTALVHALGTSVGLKPQDYS